LKGKGIPTSEDEFDCYKILHALLRDNKLELVGTLRHICSAVAATSVRVFDM
jgi:hypothetical protein